MIHKNIKKLINFSFFTFSFWSSKPWIRIHLKCWIWIHNTHKEKFNFLSSFLLLFLLSVEYFFSF
jgi:hypothetical protein